MPSSNLQWSWLWRIAHRLYGIPYVYVFFPRIIQSWYVHVFSIYFHIFPIFVYICPLTRCLLSTRKHPSFQHTNCCQQNFPAGGRKSMTASGFFQSLPGTGSHCSTHHKKGVELRKMNQRLPGVAYITCYNYNYIILLANTACCPDINIEDAVLLNKIGEIAENTAYTESFLV